MRFKLDENLPREAALTLSNAGHDALTIHDQKMVGEPDQRVSEVCKEEARVLVTLDLDFADIRSYPPQDHCGIIIVRPRTQVKSAILSLIVRLVGLLEVEPIDKKLWILQEHILRIREGEQE